MMQRNTAKRMIEAAGLFLDSLAPEQRAKALLRMDSGEHMNWREAPLLPVARSQFFRRI
jgi:hypothetical protein